MSRENVVRCFVEYRNGDANGTVLHDGQEAVETEFERDGVPGVGLVDSFFEEGGGVFFEERAGEEGGIGGVAAGAAVGVGARAGEETAA